MAAYTIANLRADGVNVGTAAAHRDKSPSPYLVSIELDFVAITAARLAASLTALATNDTLQLFNVPAKTLVLAVGVDCTTLNTVAATLDIGFIAGDVDGWVDGFNTATVNSAVGIGTLMKSAVAGNYIAVDDTLDMTMLTAPQDTSVIRVWALLVDCAGPE